MKKTINLLEFSLTPLSPFEIKNIEGGSFWTWLVVAATTVAAVGAIIGSGGLLTGAVIGVLVAVGGQLNEALD
ncbi:MAG: hypothetical protein ACK5NK_07440 [Niabella sp.]